MVSQLYKRLSLVNPTILKIMVQTSIRVLETPLLAEY